MEGTMADRTLDCTALKCPMPIVEISKVMRQLAQGQTLEVQASDPSFRADVQAWARRTGNELVSLDDGKVATAVLRKVAP